MKTSLFVQHELRSATYPVETTIVRPGKATVWTDAAMKTRSRYINSGEKVAIDHLEGLAAQLVGGGWINVAVTAMTIDQIATCWAQDCIWPLSGHCIAPDGAKVYSDPQLSQLTSSVVPVKEIVTVYAFNGSAAKISRLQERWVGILDIRYHLPGVRIPELAEWVKKIVEIRKGFTTTP